MTARTRFRGRGASTAATTAAAALMLAAAANASTVAQPPVAVAMQATAGQTPAPGDFFIDPYQLKNSPVNGPEIVDDQGRVIWYRPMPAGESASNFQVQTYQGKPVLTWWQGSNGNPAFGAISSIGIGQGEDVIMNSHYQVIKVIHGVGDLQPDAHEFNLTPNGDALVSAYTTVPDQTYLTALGLSLGKLTVVDSHALLIDVQTGQVLKDWDALKHVPLGNSVTAPVSPWDYFHINSISLAPDGDWLISSRNTSALYDINPTTGAVNWELGGRGSSFTLGKGVKFAYQHDSRFTGPDQISLFDDEAGAPFTTIGSSRAEWVDLDFTNHTATLARQITQPAGQTEAWSQGGADSLADGGTVVGWGSSGTFSEYSPSGTQVLLGRLPGGPTITVGGIPVKNVWQTYRAFKETWTGTPAAAPQLGVQAVTAGQWTATASWNGATQVTAWRVLAGHTKTDLKTVATTAWNGLTTSIPLSGSGLRYTRVQALGPGGRPLKHGRSALTTLPD